MAPMRLTGARMCQLSIIANNSKNASVSLQFPRFFTTDLSDGCTGFFLTPKQPYAYNQIQDIHSAKKQNEVMLS
jgi:hypothetical protein